MSKNLNSYFGPFPIYINNKRVIYSFIDYSKQYSYKAIKFRLNFGCLVFGMSKKTFNEYYSLYLSNGIDEVAKYLKQILNKAKFEEWEISNRIYCRGIPHITNDFVYILGSKKKIVNNPNDITDETFFSTSLESTYKIFDQLALAHFKKRTEYYQNLMGLSNKKIDVKLTYAFGYNGINYITKGRIGYDPTLYAFRECVSDAIVVHELAHCFQANHSNEFYKIVLQYCPSYFVCKKIIDEGDFDL